MQTSREQVEDVLFQALAHPMRRDILSVIAANREGVTYTELINEMGLSTGKLNYHIEQLCGLITKNDAHRYVLTPFGEKALNHLMIAKRDASPSDENYVKIACLSQKASLQPIIRLFLFISIAASFVFISIWGFMGYIAITEGAPIIVYVILPILLAIGIGVLGTLIYALKKTPKWIKSFEQRFFGYK